MQILPERVTAVDSISRKLIANKARYQAAQAQTGVPWFMIAVLHNRESDADFATQLGNGDPLNRVSTNVPAGRGPFSTWAEGAFDALVTLKHLDKITSWPIERIAYECERYNGMGYRNKGVPSAYLWSFSNIYEGGKYIADGVWSATAMDQQCGTMPLLKRMMEIDTSISFAPPPVKPPPIIPPPLNGEIIDPDKPADERLKRIALLVQLALLTVGLLKEKAIMANDTAAAQRLDVIEKALQSLIGELQGGIKQIPAPGTAAQPAAPAASTVTFTEADLMALLKQSIATGKPVVVSIPAVGGTQQTQPPPATSVPPPPTAIPPIIANISGGLLGLLGTFAGWYSGALTSDQAVYTGAAAAGGGLLNAYAPLLNLVMGWFGRVTLKPKS